jgi:hypothetical protein
LTLASVASVRGDSSGDVAKPINVIDAAATLLDTPRLIFVPAESRFQRITTNIRHDALGIRFMAS